LQGSVNRQRTFLLEALAYGMPQNAVNERIPNAAITVFGL